MAYASQQQAIFQGMIAYLQNPANWAGGVPLVTDFSHGSVVYTILAAVATGIDTIGQAIWNAQQAAYILTAVGGRVH